MVILEIALTIWDILIFLTFDVENLGQGHMMEKRVLIVIR